MSENIKRNNSNKQLEDKIKDKSENLQGLAENNKTAK